MTVCRPITHGLMVVILGLLLVGYGSERSSAANLQQTAGVSQETVQFQNGAVTLVGTLLTPATPGPHPALVIVHGARPNEREPYRRFASDLFVKHGVAVLIYDKRGYGDSSGEPNTASLYDLADDASAAVRYLQRRPDVDPTRIGLQGDSQAGWIMPIVATRTPDVAFIVMVAASAVSPAQQEAFSLETRLRSAGLAEWMVDSGRQARQLMDDYAYAVHQGRLPAIAALRDVISLRTDHDPVPVLEQVTQPILIILGEDDQVVSTQRSATIFDTALRKAGNRDYTIIVYPNANHGIQVPTTNAKGETVMVFVEGYRDTMTHWVLAHVRGTATAGSGIQAPIRYSAAAIEQSATYDKPAWYGTATVQLLLISVFAVIFGSATIGWIGGLVMRARRSAQLRAARSAMPWARLVGLITSVLNLLLLICVLGLIAVLLLSGDEVVIPTFFNAMPALAFLALALTVGMGVFTIIVWKRRMWSWPGRVHYSLVFITSLLFLVFLSYWA